MNTVNFTHICLRQYFTHSSNKPEDDYPFCFTICSTGLDCKFLQGDATDFKRVRAFMRDLMASGGKANLDILNYNKDDTLSHNVSYCVPIVDDCGHDNSQEVSHIALVLVKSSEVHHSSDCADLLEGRVLEEVGMPLDRREGCNAYPHRQIVPAPGVSDWLRLTDGLPLALMLRYMLRTQAPIVLIDRYHLL